MQYADASPGQVRKLIREGVITGPTAGMAKGYAQANLVVLPKDVAFDFMIFAQRNSKACPLLDVTDIGSYEPSVIAPGSDIRYDIPQYRIYENGVPAAEVQDIASYWRDDLVAFLIGCSFTFESPMLDAGIPIRHIEEGCNVPMYITNRQCRPAGMFHGPMVVSMRPVPYEQVVQAVQITSRFPAVHGAPVHIGDPSILGIRDVSRPDFGDSVTIKPGEVPVFWACGVTPQAIAMASKPPFMITHAPGHMFISDIPDRELAVF